MVFLEDALEHLKGVIQENNDLYSLGWYLFYGFGDKKATLDGEFTADDLEAIAVYMRAAAGGSQK